MRYDRLIGIKAEKKPTRNFEVKSQSVAQQRIDEDTYQVQVVSWYDNENSYTSQMVRTIKYFAELN